MFDWLDWDCGVLDWECAVSLLRSPFFWLIAFWGGAFTLFWYFYRLRPRLLRQSRN